MNSQHQVRKLITVDRVGAGMVYYTQQITESVGIGNVIFFATEQHPKKRENKVGTLTMRMSRQAESDAETCTQVLVKCCNVGPVLSGIINKECTLISKHQDPLCKHINAYLYRQYSNAAGAGNNLSCLSDRLYVFGVEFAAGNTVSTNISSPWDNATPPSAQVRASGTVADCFAGAGRGVRSNDGDNVARGKGVSTSTSSMKSSSTVHIKFCRVEDVPLIMQAIRVFFRQLSLSGERSQVDFPRGQMPMWYKILHDPPFDFKKGRDDFSNVEVVEQFRERTDCHFFSCLRIDDSDIVFSSRQKTDDGNGWIPVLYVDVTKLMFIEGYQLRQRLLSCV